jgi:hypothetical protein
MAEGALNYVQCLRQSATAQEARPPIEASQEEIADPESPLRNQSSGLRITIFSGT